jgi:hypothetical protein
MKTMLLPTLCLASLLLSSGGALADSSTPDDPSAAACAAAPPPEIAIDFTEEKPEIDRHLSYQQLSQSEANALGPAVKRGKAMFGFTQSTIEADGGFSNDQAELSSGQICQWATQVTVRIIWTIQVSIAAEIKPGTCPDQAVRDHEQKHVALDRQFQPLLRQQITAALRAPGALTELNADPDSAAALLRTRFNVAITTVVQDFLAMRNRQQLTIDTPAEYERVLAVCGKETFTKLFK